MPKTELEILREARELISVPERWCQGTSALNGHGRTVRPGSPSAARWCALAALMKCSHRQNLTTADFPALKRFAPAGISGINDFEGQETVLDIFDRAIASLEAGK